MHLPATPYPWSASKSSTSSDEKERNFHQHGRGPTVAEAALIQALRENWIAGAGLDVFQVEPLKPDNPLIKMPHVILSPHNASA